MSQENNFAEQTCLIPTFERNRYFFGKPMTVRDFEAEQQYLIGQGRLQHRLIHGSGIICGLIPSDPKFIESKPTILLSEGAALDCCGKLIVVNKADPIEVLVEDDQADGLHYLYLRYSECIRQPVRAAANVASCDEVCCYSRIRETFEVVLSKNAPNAGGVSFTGLVTAGGRPMVGARVKAFRSHADPPVAVESETLTDANGKFTLMVPPGVEFEVVASATGYQSARTTNTITTTDKSEKDLGELKLAALTSPVAPADVCLNLSQDYFEAHAASSHDCDNPRVFLAAVRIAGNQWTIEPTSIETRRNRAVVYTNPMLHDLFCDHVTDFSNPHRTTAAQVKALQNINGVGNSDESDKVVPRIDIVGETGGTITIDNNPSANRITIGGPHPATALPASVGAAPQRGTDAKFAREDHVHDLHEKVVDIKHLSDGTLTNLLFSPDSSINVAVANSLDPATRRIGLKAKMPLAATVDPSQVESTPKRGTSPDYARADHVHNLDDRVVTKLNLADEVINTLIEATDTTKPTIAITRDLTTRQIRITTTPATDVTSVGRQKSVGTSLNFARQDHVHNFLINDKGPDSTGRFRLTPGRNVTIESEKAGDNELIISATATQSVTNVSSKVTTGLVRFTEVKPQATVVDSPPIKHGLEARNFAIVLSVVTSDFIGIGDLSILDSSFDQNNPRFVAFYTEGADNFRIILRDTRPPKDQTPTSYTLRWWAIPSTNEIPAPGAKEDLAGGLKDVSGSPGEVLTEIKGPSA
jgi:hypothetical protein